MFYWFLFIYYYWFIIDFNQTLIKYYSWNNSAPAVLCLVASGVSNSLQPYGPQPYGPALWTSCLYSPGKNTGVGCHVLPRGSSQPGCRTLVSCFSWIASRFFTMEPTGKPNSAPWFYFSCHLFLFFKLGCCILFGILLGEITVQYMCVPNMPRFLKNMLYWWSRNIKGKHNKVTYNQKL